MNRKEAISIVANKIANSPIISANGFISRDLFESYDKPSNFYMIGSMGLASSIGVGVALKNTKKKIYVFDGDGNILMNLGSFATIGFLKPKNLVHIIFDNSIHESTGGRLHGVSSPAVNHFSRTGLRNRRSRLFSTHGR